MLSNPNMTKKIGIMVKASQNIFSNGCVQQGYFVMKALRQAGYNVTFVTVEENFQKFDIVDEPIINVLKLENLQKYSIFIFSSLVIYQKEFLCYTKHLGIRLIYQLVGNYYIINQEEFVFGHHKGIIQSLINDYVDELWLMPMYQNCKQYIEFLTNKPVKICPYVWDDEFIEKYVHMNNIQVAYNMTENYKEKPLDILIMEPNVSTHKTSLTPLLIANQFFRENPEKMGNVYLVAKPQGNKEWMDSINHLEIVKMGKIQAFDRMISLEFFKTLRNEDSKYVLISSNIRNGLNFLHLECFTLGIPIIHNCKPFAKNGLYFDECDVDINLKAAVHHLNTIWENPLQQNRQAIQEILDTYHFSNSNIITGYNRLIKNIMKTKKNCLGDFRPILEYVPTDLDVVKTQNNDIGIITYMDQQTDSSIFLKSLEYITKNLPNFKVINLDIYFVDNLSPIFRDNVESQYSKYFKMNFKKLEDNNQAFEFRLLANSTYKHTVFFSPYTVVAFNFVDLIEKIGEPEYVIGINNKNSYGEIILKANHYLINSLKMMSINKKYGEELSYIDNHFLIFAGERFKQYCNLFYENHNNLIDYIDKDFYISYILFITNYNKIVFDAQKQYLGNYNQDKKNYSNAGYINLLNDKILFLVFDERLKKDINVRAIANVEKSIKNGHYIKRHLEITEIFPFSI